MSRETLRAPVRDARLALADGAVFRGEAFGAAGRGVLSVAEVVFNTAMTGYQEALTDPSYAGQILVATFPMIGDYGVNPEDVESARVQVAGYVVRELTRQYSNYRATGDLDTYLAGAGVLGLAGVDTRALTRRLRNAGVMPGVLTDRDDLTDADLLRLARQAPAMTGQNLVPLVGCTARQTWHESLGDWAAENVRRTQPADKVPRFRVLALDCGAKRNIFRHLRERGCDVSVLPHDTPAEEIRTAFERGEYDGLFISNGPGDPAAVRQTIETLRRVVFDVPPHRTPPTFGICLGHQLLALAAGGQTFKLKFGHRGVNQPVLNRQTGKVEITSQNHGFAVDPASLDSATIEATHIHLNDGTLAGFRCVDRPVFAVQYHPEASPGPHDAAYLFDRFVEAMAACRAGSWAPASPNKPAEPGPDGSC